ncbi:MAG TPA: type II toxin-antitoxin system RelE/ParE family toxin [Nostocaceae cyanobacterium]|nr:type II toxin-antitoxin system RelE/ParE family toxin [Nostocaceae cyanobacterium]
MSYVTRNIYHCLELIMSPPEQYPKYRDKRTEKFALGERVKEFQSFAKQAYKRLDILEAAPNKETLMLLPSNHFEALEGDRKGQYSIRINEKWRICFNWPDEEPEPYNIEITDYH